MMRKKFRRSVSRAASVSPRLGISSFFGLVGVISCHRFELIETPTFFIATGLAGMLALTALALAVRGLADLWMCGAKGGRSSIKGMILSLTTLFPLALAGAVWLAFPSIYDISTNLENPPPLFAPSRPLTALSVVEDFEKQAASQLRAWPDLSGRRYNNSPDQVLKAVESVLEAQGWKKDAFISLGNSGSGENEEILIAIIARLPLLGFVSDIVIRLSDEDEATLVDARVVSRNLVHDLGSGAYYIGSFMQALDREVLLGAIEWVQD